MSDGDNITINVTGGKQAQVAGKIVNNNSHVGDVLNGAELTAEKFFAAVKEELSQLPEADRQVVHQEAVEPLERLAVCDSPDLHKSVEQSTFQKYLDFLRPHAALIVRCTAAFGEAALTALVSKNPIVAGVVAIAGEVRRGV